LATEGVGWAADFAFASTLDAGGSVGSAFKAWGVTFATGMAFEFVGHGSFKSLHAGVGNVAGHAVVGCVSSVASGGDCRSGALSAAVGSAWSQWGYQFDTSQVAANTAMHAIVGGTASVVGGGKFENGAKTAAFGYLFNQMSSNGFPNFDPIEYLKDYAREAFDFILMASPAGVAERLAAKEAVTVGRWMSEAEYSLMVNTGKVQESLSGTTHVANPAAVEAFMKQAAPGSRYVEFSVPVDSLKMTNQGWAKVVGPNSLEGRLATMKGNPAPQMPTASDISWIASKLK
jgi:hypothetical protein